MRYVHGDHRHDVLSRCLWFPPPQKGNGPQGLFFHICPSARVMLELVFLFFFLILSLGLGATKGVETNLNLTRTVRFNTRKGANRQDLFAKYW